MPPLLPSRIDRVQFMGRAFYVKRDDLIDSCFSGNKYRKLYTLIQTPSSRYNTIVSYGGAQSNAMLSIACLCKSKGWEFHYYTKELPEYLVNSVEGNLEEALKQGMQLHQLPHGSYEAKIEELKLDKKEKSLLVPQGGADEIAQEGILLLAEEINEWKAREKIEKLRVVLPSGTGTTALYLKSALDNDIELYTSALVGEREYLKEQWKRLSRGPYPLILHSEKKRKFAKPYDEYLQIHQELQAFTGITFDLIYAPKTWMEILEELAEDEGEILYIHTGGVSGNETMLQRYRHQKNQLNVL